MGKKYWVFLAYPCMHNGENEFESKWQKSFYNGTAGTDYIRQHCSPWARVIKPTDKSQISNLSDDWRLLAGLPLQHMEKTNSNRNDKNPSYNGTAGTELYRQHCSPWARVIKPTDKSQISNLSDDWRLFGRPTPACTMEKTNSNRNDKNPSYNGTAGTELYRQHCSPWARVIKPTDKSQISNLSDDWRLFGRPTPACTMEKRIRIEMTNNPSLNGTAGTDYIGSIALCELEW